MILRAPRIAHTLTAVMVALTGAVAAGCGSNDDSVATFSRCGNGVRDSGEACDDGNQLDNDTCTTICQVARCGDQVVQTGVEACDGFQLNGSTCASFGLSGSGLRCVDCAFDTNACGPPFTPAPTAPPATATITPTATPTATATLRPGEATFTPTPTMAPTPPPCGDGLLGPGETCDSCPQDCQVSPCTPSGATARFSVSYAQPPGGTSPGANVLLSYRSSVLSIPGSGRSAQVRARVAAVPPPPLSLTPNDLDYALDVILFRSFPISGPQFTVTFDVCAGSRAPSAADLACRDNDCPTCTCTATGPLP
jgi:cysteine-rich repeat protein